MKITFVVDFAGLAGGVRVIATYANLLAERGHEVTVVSCSTPYPPWKHHLRHLIRNRRLAKPVPRTTLFDPLGTRHKVVSGTGPITDRDVPDADVVVATLWKTADWVAALSPSKGRKVYLLQDYEMFETSPKERVARSYTYDFKRIAVSDYIRQEIALNHAVSDIEVIPNSVDMGTFTAPPRQKNTRLTLGFLYQTRASKNIDLALNVAREAMRRYPDIRILSFGASPPYPEHPLPEGVDYHLRPSETEIPEIYASCDGWLFTSDAEGFGLPILEAMACRTPVLATRAGAAPQLIADGQNGWLLDSDPAAFLDRIGKLQAMSSEDWRAVSDAALATAASWTWEDATARLEELIAD